MHLLQDYLDGRAIPVMQQIHHQDCVEAGPKGDFEGIAGEERVTVRYAEAFRIFRGDCQHRGKIEGNNVRPGILLRC
jgi:hypothetical protein